VIVRALAEERFGVSVADSKNQRTFVLNQTIKQIYATFLFFKKKRKENRVAFRLSLKKYKYISYSTAVPAWSTLSPLNLVVFFTTIEFGS